MNHIFQESLHTQYQREEEVIGKQATSVSFQLEDSSKIDGLPTRSCYWYHVVYYSRQATSKPI